MKKTQCKEGLDIYKKFLTRMTRISEFLKVAEVATRSDISCFCLKLIKAEKRNHISNFLLFIYFLYPLTASGHRQRRHSRPLTGEPCPSKQCEKPPPLPPSPRRDENLPCLPSTANSNQTATHHCDCSSLLCTLSLSSACLPEEALFFSFSLSFFYPPPSRFHLCHLFRSLQQIKVFP